MKKLMTITAILYFILAGCSTQKMHTYDTSSVEEAVDALSFDPLVPKEIPFEPSDIQVDTPEMGEGKMLAIQYTSEGNESFLFRAINENGNALDFTTEDIEISDSQQGRYGKNGDLKTLRWKNDEVNYEVFANDDISKSQLLEVARKAEAIK
ncbi:DUF4367 domain-containing protein [Thalassobacillus sp. B23F22_16]|uniref:DUF4367 domain-containing protein n=1 Tax=Thalassobacillus sp. B23F22_16 TaxID=3459513 RepID=UPI00373E5A99